MRDGYCLMISFLHRAGGSVVVVRDDGSDFGDRKRDRGVLGGKRANGTLMLLLRHLPTQGVGCLDARIRVTLVVPEGTALLRAEENLTGLRRQMRVDVAGDVLLSCGRSFKEVLGASSAGADLVILGMA